MNGALFGAWARLARSRFGGDIQHTSDTISVGVAATEIVGNEPEAIGLIIINLSGNTVFITPDENPSSARGIQINANGGNVSMNAEDDGPLPALSWFGLATAAASTVYFIRLTRFNIAAE